jgi:hypothetical protein
MRAASSTIAAVLPFDHLRVVEPVSPVSIGTLGPPTVEPFVVNSAL